MKPAEMKMLSEENPKDYQKYIKEVDVGDKKIIVMVDPGSSSCTITRMAVLEKRFTIVSWQNSLKAFGPELISVNFPGYVRADFTVHMVTAKDIIIRIVPYDTQPCKVLVGRMLTDFTFVVYIKTDDHLIFNYREA